ncbi:MAG: hypothetical protein ACXIT9_01300 [Nitritalea sp.]
MKNIQYAVLFAGLFAWLMVACSPRTVVTGTWKSPEADKMYERVFVAALMDDLRLRSEVEQEFATRFANRDVETVKSLNSIQPDFFDEEELSQEKLLAVVRETGSEAIMTVRLLDINEEERFVPGGVMGPRFAPMGFGHYGTFGGYWNHWYGNAWNTGYVSVDKTYVLETNLYDAESLSLVYSAQSETLNPSDMQEFAEAYVDKLKASLREEGLIQ